jgi:lipopolysaccharide transport system permease protein
LSLITYRNIVTKTYFPREIVPLAQVASRLVDLGASAGLYALLMIYYGVVPGVWFSLLPLFILMLIAFTIGVTFTTSAINVFYRDVNPVVQIGLQLWLYLTPVAYPLSAVPERYRIFFMLNPLSAVVEGLRSSLVYNRAPDATLVAVSATIIAALLFGSIVMFKRLDKYFADVI